MLKKPLQKGYANNIHITNMTMNSSTFYMHGNKPRGILNRLPFLGLRLFMTVLSTNDFEKKMMRFIMAITAPTIWNMLFYLLLLSKIILKA
ncbi:MAG: hypothetical protein EZS28_025891 [Streblomastix strix]|uniref:Uncharacterized protein n=1 Tax=Streblomastix strix TaxID=222440 RepID=A0A5J4V7W4_9EUKA|nr:MAG: hypothetical protein EZS28_025891 [Streblomastix strix]